ncbi:MAG: glycine cleavage system aminomethyltransferase GcvT, partial [Elusimicrobia bacterium]|nr:glycine cleavage system aminomethyltransferase GcvT [Elusimicrobiota bacterium]
MSATQTIRKTPLYDSMVKAGGKIVDFHGWALPIQFAGILQEHKAVRTACGIFDVSHMGQVFVTGPDAHKLLQLVNANDIKDIPSKGEYSHVLNPKGGLVDDVIPFCLSKERFLVVVNATTSVKDFEWVKSQSKGLNVKVENASDRYGMIALQGPTSLDMMNVLCPDALKLPRFCILETKLFGQPAFITRTGYTGEDGFEVMAEGKNIIPVWDFFIKKGAVPCGLGSRDTLRLEAGYLLYGQDVDDDHTTYEA